MERPIFADEARRIEEKRAQAARDNAAAAAPPAQDNDASRRAARRKHYVAIAHPRPERAVTHRSVAMRPPRASRAPAAIAAGPINSIFVLAPRPFDPYGGDYAPWLDRLAWSSRFDRAGDRTVFSADGYREAEIAPMPDVPSAQDGATQDLSRRFDALSQQGFQTLKTDLGGG